eukprot:GHVQ01021092.1.p2 GENE.GHVQ01021092.1~~GHVQ01021092.1.p2  ORF type:complete len:113 (-),score=27.04 GHVQ01021092.1:23-361(-)
MDILLNGSITAGTVRQLFNYDTERQLYYQTKTNTNSTKTNMHDCTYCNYSTTSTQPHGGSNSSSSCSTTSRPLGTACDAATDTHPALLLQTQQPTQTTAFVLCDYGCSKMLF